MCIFSPHNRLCKLLPSVTVFQFPGTLYNGSPHVYCIRNIALCRKFIVKGPIGISAFKSEPCIFVENMLQFLGEFSKRNLKKTKLIRFSVIL